MNTPAMLTVLYHVCYFITHAACMLYKPLCYRHVALTCSISVMMVMHVQRFINMPKNLSTKSKDACVAF